jgi:hypothetical protein
MSEWWFSRGDGKTEGPLSTQALVNGLIAGQIPKQIHVCRVGEQQWVRASQIDEIWESANPEQIRTNITERPWFLSAPESGHTHLPDVETDDERTQLLTPLPIVTPNGGGRPFVTPLPHPATHRELFARHPAVTATPKTAPGPHVGGRGRAADPVDHMRAKVPTLDGISEASPPGSAPGPSPDVKSKAATLPDPGVRTPPGNQGKTSPFSSLQPLGASGHQTHSPATSPLGSSKSVANAPLGLAPLAAAPVVGTRRGSALPGLPKLDQPAQSPQPTASAQPQLPPQAVARSALGSQPGIATKPRSIPAPSVTQAKPLSFPPSQPLAQRPQTSALPQANVTPQPNRPTRTELGKQPPRKPADPPAAVRPDGAQPEPADKETLALVEDGDLTTIANRAPVATRPPGAAEDEDELTTIAQKALLPTRSETKNPTPLANHKPLQPVSNAVASGGQAGKPIAFNSPRPDAKRPPVASRNDASQASPLDDEATRIVSAPIALRTQHRATEPHPGAPASPAQTEDESTTIVHAPVAPRAPARAAKPVPGAPPPSVDANGVVGPPVAGMTPAKAAATQPLEPLLSDPSELMEEVYDEPAVPERRIARPVAAGPSADDKPATSPAPLRTQASPPSTPPPARQSHMLNAPSVVLNAEPLVHQEATQPAARALRRSGSTQLSYGSLLVVFLALALIALAVVYFVLKHR